ncbi:MAG: adenosylhomocysteinase [Candidatus Woesearchaeota archaeon]
MDSLEGKYSIKDMKLAPQGKKNIELAEGNMKGLMSLKQRFEKQKPLDDMLVGLALHITKETAVLVKTLMAGGAEVAICSCNPLSTQDDVAAALAEEGAYVYGYKGESTEEYYQYLDAVIRHKPSITIDDGCDLVSRIHSDFPGLIESVEGGTEETTTGVIRLKAMEKDNALKYPVIAVNDNKTKHLMDNHYGTGQSTMDGLLRASNVLIAGKNFVVCGYGNCGRGVADRANGLNANVIVTEVEPVKALQAHYDGYRVMPMDEAAKIGDIFLTVTGCKNVITLKHMKKMRDGAMLANSGHFNHEIDINGLEKHALEKRDMRPLFDEYVLPKGKKLYVAGEGRLVNLAAAEGHPSEVMSLSFMGQALAAEYIAKHTLDPGVISLPKEVDDEIARIHLDSIGVRHDQLTREQKKYLESWEEGT